MRRLDRQMAQRIVDFMDQRIAPLTDPRATGKALTGPLGGLWRYRVGDCRVVCDLQDGALRVLVCNRSLIGVLFPPAPTRNNPSHIHQGGAGSDQGDSDQQQVAAA